MSFFEVFGAGRNVKRHIRLSEATNRASKVDDPSATARGAGDGELTRRQTPPGMPRWVKVFAIIAAVVVVLFLAVLLTGSDHSPGRHLDGGDGPPRRVEHSVPHP